MWNYEKRLQFPVNIKEPNAKLAQVIMSQYGGPDGEMGASMRYLSQRYATPYREVSGLLTDIGVSVAKLRIIGLKCTLERQSFQSFMIFEQSP
ncbi:MAG: spore coat protein CotJC [Lachnospiraceae bacterium]|nr:spore coat protein CotJC [Lachnospiraceae bacterium]